MLTAGFMTYSRFLASQAYQEGTKDAIGTPIDWGCLDAPESVPSGGHARVQSITDPEVFFALPGAALRQGVCALGEGV